MIRGLNHITLAVRDLDVAQAFYVNALGARLARRWDTGAYLELGDIWLCLSLDASTAPATDYTHIALDVAEADFAAVAGRITSDGATIWKDNRSEGKSLYFLDPDGHRLELHVGTLASRLAAMEVCV